MLDFTKTLTEEPLIHPSCVVTNCSFGEYVELGDNCIAADSHIGSYTYLFGHNDIYNCTLGKFNSIATGVRINPVQHPMRDRVVAHHLTYRAAHYGLGEDDPAIIDWRLQLTVHRPRRMDRSQRDNHGRSHPRQRRSSSSRSSGHS